MEGREAMAFPGAHPSPFYFARGAFTSIPASQSASALHAPPGFRPMSNPNLHQQPPPPQHTFPNSGHPFPPFGEQRHHQDFSHGIHMGMASSSPAMQPPVAAAEPVVKKKRGRPRKYVPDNKIDLGLSPMSSSHKPKNSSSMSDPNAPKRARGRPPGTGRKQRLADLDTPTLVKANCLIPCCCYVNSDPESVITELFWGLGLRIENVDIVSKVLSFSLQRPRALCIMSGTGTASSVTLCQTGSSVPNLSFQGPFEILSLGGSYLVNEEGGSKSRTGGISVSLCRSTGELVGGGVGTLIAASLVQVVACSFVYGSAKVKAIKQENGSKEDKKSRNNSNVETPKSEPPPPPPPPATESEAEAAQTPPDFSSPGWSGSGGGNRSIDSRNHNHLTDIDLTRG
ncbi:unnamed protein product [Thlaspi arvense]|uniref:AT-hook motif nuclear-localized protein n=1 Tax=Thlaspi arvense TaxID=13288 RepID=A0AAU9TBH4_THLAR|nr:unnamed protein product [Thlaspi arvense]